jgi:hypothetical protein
MNHTSSWVCTALIKARRTNTQCAGRQVESHYNLTHTAAARERDALECDVRQQTKKE